MRQGIRSRLPACVDANAQQGQGDPTQEGPRGRSHLGEMPDGLACLDTGGWGWGRLQGLEAGVGPLSVQTRCEEGLACQGGREGKVKTRHTQSHPHKPGGEPG